MEKYRSFGISIISGFEIWFGGLMTLVGGILSLVNIFWVYKDYNGDYVNMFFSLSVFPSVVIMVVSGLTLLAGMLTYALNQAGRILNLFISSLFILIYMAWFIFSPSSFIGNFFYFPISFSWLLFFAPLISSAILIIFFLQPGVEEQFR